MSDAAFRQLDDYLRATEPDEQARNLQQMVRPVDAFDSTDPYSPYLPSDATLAHYGTTPAGYSSATLPLVNRNGAYQDDGDADYDRKTFMTDAEDDPGRSGYDDNRSMNPSEAYAPSRALFDSRTVNEKAEFEGIDEDVVVSTKQSKGRRRWVALTWIFTWWIPSFFLSKCGGMKRSDVRMAWREKLLIK